MDIDCPSVPPIDKNGWTTIEIGKSCEKIVYYPEVNALLCYHRPSDIASLDGRETFVNVLEITTGQILKTFHFASNIDHVMSLMKQKKVLIGTGNVLGLTREVGGCLYLDTCLQLPTSTSNQNCILELSYEEVKVLQPWFEAMQKSKELTETLRTSTDKVVAELKEAMKQLPNDKQLSESGSSHLTNVAKKLKWHSVKISMTIDDFLEILEGIYAFRFTKEREEIFGDRGSNESTDYQLLPILFAVIDRLACLHASGRQLFLKLEELVSKEPNSDGSHDIGVGGFVPGMCSEYARRLTFITWPHYSYKWAKPDSMAKAGFYHTKGAHNGKDGVQCFKCRINLVKWEASDEPWNEHEQHSPNCLFLRGEPTHNVPIANTIAFSPAVKSSDEKAISVISNSNHPFFVASSSTDGCINVWNCCAVPKLYFNFSIDASDEQIANVFARYTDSPSASNKHKLYNKEGQEMKGIASMLPSFFMEEVSSDPTTVCPEPTPGKGPKKSAANNGQLEKTVSNVPDGDDDCVITCLSETAGGSGQKMETADNPTVIFPLEEDQTSSKIVDCVQVTSLALSGFEGVNPSPLGCVIVVGCKVADPRSPMVSSNSTSNVPVDRETCLLVYKVDCSDLRATKTALFHQPPDHTNLLAMDDKYSNFASEIAASHPIHSAIDDMMMIGDLNEDGIHMEIELAHSPEMLDPTDAPNAMGGDPLLYNDYSSPYGQTATANVYESEMLTTGSSEFSGVPNKLYNLLDAKLMQAMPLQAGSEITHIIMEQYGTQPFFYVITSKDSTSAVYVFLMEKIFNSFHLRANMNASQKQQNVIKMHCNQQFAQGVIKHALLLPLWSCNLGEYPLFVTTTTSSDLSSVLLCVSDKDDILLFKLPKLECITLQTEADKNLFGGNKIKSVSFDCGSDSLCVLTSDGKVHFVEMRKLLGEQDDKESGLNTSLTDAQEGDEMDCGVGIGTSTSADGKVTKSTSSNQIATSASNTNAISIVRPSGVGSGQQQQMKQLQHQSVNRFDYLPDAKGKTPDLNTATLDWISQLSECVPLTPRFLTGLVPSGWVEVEQEQQQRKFSEHLPSSGGSVLHTRTFRVNKESSSCVTVLELQLPFAVVLGHVDVKIQLKKSTNVNDLTATLSCPSEISGGVVSRDNFSQTNRKLLGPVPLKLFRFGQQGLSINVSLTGPKLYLMKHRVLFLELGSKGTTSNSLNLHEVSITVRKMKKPPTARTIAQVQTVLEDTSLVEKLLAAVIEPERNVHTVGDTKEFFMSGPTVRQTALTSLTWLLYTHATDSSNSREYLASFFSKCFNGNGGRMMGDLVQVCFIEGDRSLAHLFARFLAVLLKFLVTLSKQERSEFFDSFKQTLLDMLPKMVTCASHGGMHWFQLFFYQVVVTDTRASEGSANSIQSAFSICLDLLDHLVDCSENSQDTFTKTLQNKFRLFCNPFEQKILTFPMQTIIAHDSPKQVAGGGGFGNNSFFNPLPAGGGKWYMSGGGPLGAGGSTTNYVQQLVAAGGPLPTGSESLEIVKNMIQLQSSRKSQHFDPLSSGSGSAEQLSSQSFVDLFVPLNFVGFTLDNYLIGFLEAEPLRVSCVEASDGVKMHQISSGNEVVGGHSGQHTLVEYEDTVNEPGMTPTLVQLINVAAASASAHNQHMGGPAGPGGAYNSMFSGSGWGPNPPGGKHYNLTNHQGAGGQLFHLTPGGNKSYADAAKSHHGTGGAVSGSQAGRGSGTPVSDAIVGSIGGSLTHTPQPQYMMIDNLHPGVRKFVVLDFGRTIVLSDVFLGPCPDLASITLDCWVKGEALDCMRVATSLDISTDALALTDLQPALHCRYLKITVSGKYGPVGSSASSAAVLGSGAPGGGQNKVLLPINTFYGHSLDTEYELIPKENKIRSVQELQERHLKTLAIVHDDLLCRYSLASNHLKSLIAPHAASISSNSQHDKRYVSEVCSNCRVLQRQLNVVTRVIERVKHYYSSVNEKQTTSTSSGGGGSASSPSGVLLDENINKQTTPLSSASTTHISHSTRFTLLSMLELAQAAHSEIIIRGTNSAEELQMLCPITEEQCDNFMNQLCIKGVPNNGILALTLLHRVCHAQIWWPRFVSSSFVKFFSESTNSDLQLHVVKIYITLLHLAKQDKIIDDVILSFVTLLLNGVENEHSQLRNPIVPPVNIASQDTNGEPMETSFEANNPGVSSATSAGNFTAPKCNWSQLSAILMIISQGMSEKQHVDGVSYKWDFFPNILNSDFLKAGMTSDKHKSGSGKKEKRGRGVGGAISSSSGIPHKAYSLMGLMPKNTLYGGASPSAALAAAKSDIKAAAELGQTPRQEKEKKPKMDMPPKMPVSAINDVRLPVRETQELIRRLLCLLPELIRSQSTDIVMLLCRVVSLLSSACDPAKGTGSNQAAAPQPSASTEQQGHKRQPIRIAALFPGNLLSNILLNAFVVTTNQLITYAVQSLIVDVMEAELGNRGALAAKETSLTQQSQSGKSSSSKQRSNSSSLHSKNHPLSTTQAATLDNAAFFGSTLTEDSNSLLMGGTVGSSAPSVSSALHSADLNLNSLLAGDLDSTTGSTAAVGDGSLSDMNQYVALSNVASSLVDKQMDFIQEMLNAPAPPPLSSSNLPPSTSASGSIPIFGQSQQYSKKGSSSGSGRSKESSVHSAACSERSGDCLDARLESGILHHSERWLNQLQAAYTSSVYQNLACLNFNPPKRPIIFNTPSEGASRSTTASNSSTAEDNPLTFEDSKRLLRNVFDELLSPRNLPYLDLKEVLLCWYNISNLKMSKKSENGSEKQTKVRIGMSSENMAQIFNKLTVENTSDSVVWTLLFRCLIVTSSNEGCIEEPERTPSAATVRSQSQSPMMRMQSSASPLGLPQSSLGIPQGAPDNLLTIGDSPSTVIIKNLISYPVLDTFLSGSWSPGGTRSEQCRGPVVTGIFGNFLDTLNESSKNRALLGPLMMKLLKSMCEFSGAIKQGYGPVDCQVELVNKMLEFQCQTQDPHIICGLVNVICKLGYDYVSRYRSSVTMTANTSTNKGNQNLPNICLTVFGSGVANSKDNLKPRSRTVTVSCNVNSRETLLKQLFKLAQTLVKTETGLGQLSNLSSNRSVADYIVCDDQISVINTLLVTLSACVLPCGSSEAMASDSFTLKHIENFVEEFMSVGGAGNKEQEGCPQSFEQRTLGDYILQLLMCVESSTRERKLLHQRLVQSLSLASPGQPPCFSPSLSQPVLCFFIHLLRNIDEVKMFSSVGGLQVLINKIIANSETGPGFNFSCQPLDILNRLTQCFQVDSLQLQGHLAAAATQSPHMPPQNIGPKAIITCVSDPGAQLPDILLQENPPHKRARSAAWTYHFPPAGSSLADCSGVGGIPPSSGGVNQVGSGSSVATEQPASCCLCITLPTLSIVHYVEIKMQTPTMGVSHMAPSSVSMDLFVSRDSSYSPSATPTCVTAPLIVSRASGGSASCIQLRPHEPRLCGSLLLTFYPPPESSSIGLSHIAIYARPVLSDMTQPQSSTDHIMTSLHAFKLIEYCMEMQLDNITKRQHHYSSSFSNISSTQSQHHHAPHSGATATTTTPDSMMMLGAIFSESFTPLTRDRLLTACLSLLTQNNAQLFFPCLKRTVLCLATLPLLPSTEHAAVVHQLDPQQRERETADCQAETIQHVIVILLDSFVSSTQPLTAVYVDEVLDLLFSLCTHSGSQQVLLNRISVLVSWLESNLLSISQCTTQSSSCLAHLVHAIACVLYQVHALYMFSLNASSGNSSAQQQQQSQSHSIPSVVSSQHFANVARYVLDAGIGINSSQSHTSGLGFGSTTISNVMTSSSVLKKAFDWLLCSYVHMYPSFLKSLLRLLGCPELQTSSSSGGSSADSSGSSQGSGPMSPPSPIPVMGSSIMNEDSRQQRSFLSKQWWANLSPSQLATLHHCLLDAKALDVFRNFAPVAEMFSLLMDLSISDERSNSEGNVKTLIRLLDFLTNMSENNPQAKRWLGQAEKTRFWSPLLTSLCYDKCRQQCLSLTDAALKFFETVVDDNQANQRNLAEIVSQLVSQKKDALNSFVKQLILNVFLKEERITVVVHSTQDKLLKWPSSDSLSLGHPKYGIGHRVVFGKVDADAPLESLIADILDPTQVPVDFLPVGSSGFGGSGQKAGKGADTHGSGSGSGSQVSKMKIKGNKLGGSMVLYSPLSQKLSKIEQKKKTLEKMGSIGGTGSKIPFAMLKHLSKMPNSNYWTAKVKSSAGGSKSTQDEQRGLGLDSNSGGSSSKSGSSNVKLWRCMHKTLGSDWLPNAMSVRQLMLCLKQLQSRDVEEGFVKLDLIGVPTEQFEMEMEVAIAETLDAMVMDTTTTAGSNYGGQQQNRLQHLRPPQVFACVGGFTKLALRIPVLNPDFVKLMCTNSKDSASSGTGSGPGSSKTGGGMGFPGSEKLDLSEWILIDQHTFGGQAGPDGAGGPGGSGKNSSYNVIDVVESSDEENYMDTFDMEDGIGGYPGSTGYGTGGSGGGGGGSASSATSAAGGVAVVAPHCLALLGLTLQLPLYVEVLLREERKARFLLRILLGVSDVGDSTTSILSTPEAKNLSTLPLEALKSLFDEYPVNTELGLVIRQQCVDAKILDLLFGCLAVLTHRNPESQDVKSYQFLFPPTLFGAVGPKSNSHRHSSHQYHSSSTFPSVLDPQMQMGIPIGPPAGGPPGKQQPQYWAKGTGFGTGSMQSGWNMEQSLLKKSFEEQNCCAILQVLASFISGTDKKTNPESQQIYQQHQMASNSSFTSYDVISNAQMQPCSSSSQQGSGSQQGSTKSHYVGMFRDQSSMSNNVAGGQTMTVVDLSNFSCRLHDLISQSCLLEVLNSYLTNDSILDMDRHVAVHQAVLDCIRAMVSHEETAGQLIELMMDEGRAKSGTGGSGSGGGGGGTNIFTNLTNIRDRHSIYHTQLNKNLKKLTSVSSSSAVSNDKSNQTASSGNTVTAAPPPHVSDVDGDGESGGVNKLSEDLEHVHALVTKALERYRENTRRNAAANAPPPLEDSGMRVRGGSSDSRRSDPLSSAPGPSSSGSGISVPTPLVATKTPSEIYCEALKPLQFLSYKMIKDPTSTTNSGSGKGSTVIQFALPFHFVTEARMTADTLNTKRAKRLAQESVSLSSALPLDYSSSVFIRYDEDRLDIMKVLITGPADTPYANGCFVFDIFFPTDYPNTPLLCNFTTTGGGTVRFNPNLYNDGKVCLSILNTWHGRPEEKWNAQTSNLLQVLVSIQSLILVSEPYFNEPGYERSRNTPAGQENSEEYSANIKQATVKWAMLNQLKSPTLCFKDVIQTHFYLKKNEILQQVQEWLTGIEVLDIHKRYAKKISSHVQSLKKSLNELKTELKKLSAPPGIEEEQPPAAVPGPQESIKKQEPIKTQESIKKLGPVGSNTPSERLWRKMQNTPATTHPDYHVELPGDPVSSTTEEGKEPLAQKPIGTEIRPHSVFYQPDKTTKLAAGVCEIQQGIDTTDGGTPNVYQYPIAPATTSSNTDPNFSNESPASQQAAKELIDSMLEVVFWSPHMQEKHCSKAPGDNRPSKLNKKVAGAMIDMGVSEQQPLIPMPVSDDATIVGSGLGNQQPSSSTVPPISSFYTSCKDEEESEERRKSPPDSKTLEPQAQGSQPKVSNRTAEHWTSPATGSSSSLFYHQMPTIVYTGSSTNPTHSLPTDGGATSDINVNPPVTSLFSDNYVPSAPTDVVDLDAQLSQEDLAIQDTGFIEDMVE